jgi:hypothetical protein
MVTESPITLNSEIGVNPHEVFIHHSITNSPNNVVTSNVNDIIQMTNPTTTSADEITLTIESYRGINISNLNESIKILGSQIQMSDVNGIEISYDSEHLIFKVMDKSTNPNTVAHQLHIDWDRADPV